MRRPVYKFVSYLSVKWLGIYSYIALTEALHWSIDSANAEGLGMLLVMLLTLPVLEAVLLYPLFRSALAKHGGQTLLLLLSAFSLELLLTCFMVGPLTAGLLAKVGFSIVLYGFFYGKTLCKSGDASFCDRSC